MTLLVASRTVVAGEWPSLPQLKPASDARWPQASLEVPLRERARTAHTRHPLASEPDPIDGELASPAVLDHRKSKISLVPSASAFETEEYSNSWSHARIGTSSALAIGATGSGKVIAVIDSGFDPDHPELVGNLHPDSIDIHGGSLLGPDGHGTAVASVIAGNRDGSGIHGVAPEALILGIRAEREGSCTPLCSFDWNTIAAATNHAVEHGAHVINYSLGGPSPSSEELNRALKRASRAGAVLVFAAGNDAAANPNYPGRHVRARWMNGQGIVAGALDANGNLAGFSARAGKTKNFYLVAPGDDVAVAVPGGGYGLQDGTSFAAPMVSGAAADVLSAWPWLTAAEAVEILLVTATDLGAKGVDPMYGRGLLNLRRVFAPVGAVRLPTGTTVAEGGIPVSGSQLRTSTAFGSALAESAALQSTIVVDDYGRHFVLDLSRTVRTEAGTVRAEDWTGPSPDVLPFGSADRQPQSSFALAQERFGRRFGDGMGQKHIERFALTGSLGETSYALSKGFGIGGYFGLDSSEGGMLNGMLRHDAFRSPFLALVEAGDGLVLGNEIGAGLEVRVGFTMQDTDKASNRPSGERYAYIAELRHSWGENAAHIGAQVGLLTEQEGMLGSYAEGAFEVTGEADTRFVGLSGALPLGTRVELYGHASLGWTDGSSLASPLFQDVGTLTTTAFGIGLGVEEVITKRSRLDLTLSQPLRVESGSMHISAATQATRDGSLVHTSERLDLSPEGRQLDLELTYRADLGSNQDLRLNYVTQFEPGHNDSAEPAHFLGVRYGLRF